MKRRSNCRKRNFVFVIVLIIITLFIAFLYKLFIGSITIRTDCNDYCYFEGFVGYSNLEIFPQNPAEISKVEDYYYCSADTLMDPTCKIVLICEFVDENKFEMECTRLSQITVGMNNNLNKIEYSEELFNYPAYVAMYDWSSCYEYALIIEAQKKIIYVFLQGDFLKVDKEYMPIDEEYKDFSIYSFDGKFDLKYR